MKEVTIGDTQGKLTVIGIKKSLRQSKAPIICRCSCGNERIIQRKIWLDEGAKSCGCNKTADIVGKTFNNLTAIEICGKIGRRWLWKCLCKCGNYTTAIVNDLKRGNKKSCGCLLVGKNSNCWIGHEKISGEKWGQILRGAKSRSLIVDITIKEAWNKFIEQEERCAISGKNISFAPTLSQKIQTTASLDRIDSSIGYTVQNTWWVHKDINYLKSFLSIKDFILWLRLISKPVKHKRKRHITCIHTSRLGYGNVSGKYFSSIRCNAKKRNIDISISPKYLWSLFLKQNGRCAITNIDIDLCPSNWLYPDLVQTASVDRINSKIGYTEDNVQWVHKDINRMKGNNNQEEFIKLCSEIYNNKNNMVNRLKQYGIII